MEKLSISDVVKRTKNSIVRIVCSNSSGTGFVLDELGIIVTNRHVIEDSNNEIEIHFFDDQSHSGKIIFIDKKIDIAFLITKRKDISPLKLAKEKDIIEGLDVIAIGHPLGLNFSITAGIISAFREMDGCEFIQTDTSINPGNSGGPLLDGKGSVVGMCTLSHGKYSGLNFAITAKEICEKYNSLTSYLKGNEKAEIKCSSCGLYNIISEKYCSNCGAILATVFAPKNRSEYNQVVPTKNTKDSVSDFFRCPCGTQLTGNVLYCQNCGRRLTEKG